MATPGNNNPDCWSVPDVYNHHEQKKVCISRPKYREGRKARAVKVYTINLESCYLMVQGVPAIGVMTELIQLCALYGTVEEYRPLDEYPAEQFTEVYLVKFQKITSARAAKRHMDEKSFYGGVLHVCYVPEYETVEDTRLKLRDRKSYVMRAAMRSGIIYETTSSSSISTSDRINPGHSENTGGPSSVSSYSGFPLLPLPPQEHHFSRRENQHGVAPTEDKMGTLHNAFIEAKQQGAPSPEHTSSNRDRHTEHTGTKASACRFVPRTTHLENRKRKIEESDEVAVSVQKQPLIGPKLPEPSRVDMEDESLNTTVSLIRNTMKQVESVPECKPVAKKVKPRRRI
uniref:RNA-binding protein 48 n=1 Tax=Salarias fasciatus TaxID=181472 RepID=A0A672I3K1_SALFA